MDAFFDSLLGRQWVFATFVAVVLFGLTEVGYRTGLRLFEARDEARRSQIGGVQTAVLGLLALLLGFTFSMGVNRFELRRDMVLKEANAVGTTWLRASLLPEMHRAPVKDLLRQFVDARVRAQKLSDDPPKLAEELSLAAETEIDLWRQAEAAAAEAPTSITATFILALNDMIDTDAARVNAHRNTIPAAVWLLLVFVAAFGCLTSSYGSGSQGARSSFTGVHLPVLVTVVIVLVFDLMNTHQGFIGISQQPLLDLQKSMHASGN